MANLYRADHIGSLLRSADLVAARHANAAPDALRALEDREIAHVVDRQHALGLDVVTDGELRRKNFMSDLTDAVDGFDTDDAVARAWSADPGAAAPGPALAPAAKVSSVTGIVTAKLA